MEDTREDPLAVHCFCVCSGNALLGDLIGVSRSIVEDADNLNSQVLYNNSHVLNSLLPSTNTRTYNLRQRAHNRTLVAKTSTLTDSDFIIRMLYKGVY